MVAGVRVNLTQGRVVGAALLAAAIKSFAVPGIQRCTELEPGYEIWIADEILAEGDEIGAAMLDRLIGARFLSKPLLAMTMPPNKRFSFG